MASSRSRRAISQISSSSAPDRELPISPKKPGKSTSNIHSIPSPCSEQPAIILLRFRSKIQADRRYSPNVSLSQAGLVLKGSPHLIISLKQDSISSQATRIFHLSETFLRHQLSRADDISRIAPNMPLPGYLHKGTSIFSIVHIVFPMTHPDRMWSSDSRVSHDK